MPRPIIEIFSNDIGIDLGTANTLVYLRGEGIVITEPSIVALNERTGKIIAIGNEAKQMMGRTPPYIKVIRPLVDGVISDFEITQEMLAYFIQKAEQISKKLLRPRIVIGVPSGVTNVEARAVYDVARNAGAREVYIVEEPMAAAIGIRLPVKDPLGSMIIDIGGGTTDIAVISLGGIVRSKNLKIAGDRLNNDIISYIREEFRVLIGEKTAEDLKISIGTVSEDEILIERKVKGRDLVTGLPKEVIVNNQDIRKAMYGSIVNLIEGVKEVLETTPPEVLSDVMNRGIVVSGGGALIKGLGELLQSTLRLPVYIAEDPITSVARGAGIIIEDIKFFKEVLILSSYDISKK